MSDIQARVQGYIDDVMSERVVVGRLERLMVERHLRDLEEGPARGLEYRPEMGELVVDFCGLLNHSKGEWAGTPLRLEPWQEFIVLQLFGWMRADGTRRFRQAYFEVARKNGKSTLAAALGLYMLVADGEGGPEIYCGAKKKEQAKIIWSEAYRMVVSSPELSGEVTAHSSSIFVRGTAARFNPLSDDDKQTSGHNTHCGILDELHEHPTDEMWNLVRTSMGSRRQPVLLMTTTAGDDENSICGQQRHYAERILRGTIEADHFLAAVYAIDDESEWREEANWRKANPNLGVSVSVDDMRELAAEAAEKPRTLNAFLRYRLNIWLSSAVRWFRPEVWDAASQAVDEESLAGRPCYGGLDLASRDDVAAWMLIFPPDDPEGVYEVLCRFFVPQSTIFERSTKSNVPYDVWVRQGHLIATPGEVIDHEFIFAKMDEDARKFDVVDVAFDRWGAARVYTIMEDRGLTMVQMGQGYVSMSGPSKELERIVRQRRLHYGEQPVMRWMGHNVVVTEDPAGNIKPDKGKAREKIDGVVALVMALDRSMRHGRPKRSVYEERGIEMI